MVCYKWIFATIMIPNVRMTNLFNLVHIMSFWGARGNSSQLHQLTGLRELMLDP